MQRNLGPAAIVVGAVTALALRALLRSGRREMARKGTKARPSRKVRAKAAPNIHWFPSPMTTNRYALRTMRRDAMGVATGSILVEFVDVARLIQCGSIIKG